MAQNAAERLELLLEVGRLLSSKLDVGELLRTVLELASRVVDAETGSLLLLDEKTQELFFDVALGLGEEASRIRLKPGQGIAGTVARSLKPEIINDVRADPRWSPAVDAQSGFVTRSILAVPMTLKGRLVGVVEAINKKDGPFTDEDLRTFEAFVSQAAVAIDNARLFSSLREEKLKLDTVFSEMTDGALLADAEGRILLTNASARKLLGVGEQPATLQEALRGLTATPSLPRILASPAPAQDFTAEREQPKKLIVAGKITRLQLAGPPGRENPGQTAWLCVFRDETQERLKEKLKRTFLSLISHKLKTPLASVTGFSSILLEDFQKNPPSPAVLKAVQTISSQGKKLADLVERLLRYATLEDPEDTLERAPCLLDEVVAAALEALKPWLAEKEVRVEYHPAAEGNLGVVADSNQLVEVVKNLVENGVKFSAGRGKPVEVSTLCGPDAVSVRVRDWGSGIPPEDQDKIFSMFHQIETFFTGQMDGWGLGLPFVKKVAESHGGRVELQSRLGEGTTVTVVLPRHKAGGGPR